MFSCRKDGHDELFTLSQQCPFVFNRKPKHHAIAQCHGEAKEAAGISHHKGNPRKRYHSNLVMVLMQRGLSIGLFWGDYSVVRFPPTVTNVRLSGCCRETYGNGSLWSPPFSFGAIFRWAAAAKGMRQADSWCAFSWLLTLSVSTMLTGSAAL